MVVMAVMAVMAAMAAFWAGIRDPAGCTELVYWV